MARVIATGPAPASLAAVSGNMLGQGVGRAGGTLLTQIMNERRAAEAANPMREALQQILIDNGAMTPGALQGVNQQVQTNPLQFALGGGQPQQPPMPAPSGQGTDPQKLLAQLQSDPKAFARLFADQGVEGIMSMARAPGQPAPVNVPEGGALVRPDTGEEIFRNQGSGPKPYTDIAELTADFRSGLIDRESYQEARRLLLDDDSPVVQVNDPTSASGLRWVREDEAAGREAPTPRSGITINNGGENAFDKANAGTVNDAIARTIEAGDTAAQMLPNIEQATNMLLSGVPTGRGQRLVLPLQQLAEDFGVDLGTISRQLGIDPETVASKEEFDRLTTEMVINGFEKFKGNLNATEVQMAVDAFGNLGRSEEANLLAMASMRAGADLAVERRAQALQAGDLESARTFLTNTIGTDVSEFERRRQAYLEQMRGQSGQGSGTDTQPAVPEQEAQSALPPNHSLGRVGADGRWEVIGPDGNIAGYIEAE